MPPGLRHRQRRLPSPVGLIGVRARLQQSVHGVCVSLPGGHVQRAAAVVGTQIGSGAVGQKVLNYADVPKTKMHC